MRDLFFLSLVQDEDMDFGAEVDMDQPIGGEEELANGYTNGDIDDHAGLNGIVETGEGEANGPASTERVTTPYMTKYERARILGTRALQIRSVSYYCVHAKEEEAQQVSFRRTA